MSKAPELVEIFSNSIQKHFNLNHVTFWHQNYKLKEFEILPSIFRVVVNKLDCILVGPVLTGDEVWVKQTRRSYLNTPEQVLDRA